MLLRPCHTEGKIKRVEGYKGYRWKTEKGQMERTIGIEANAKKCVI